MADKMIWAPWRAGFVLGDKEEGCVFCNRIAQDTDSIANLIVHRGDRHVVILNKFPYNPGHAMIVPKRHVGLIEELTAEESAEFMELTRTTVRLMKQAYHPQSLNIGMNLGRESGAGIPEHLHMHVVPRWQGDTNFMPVLGETKVMSVPLDYVYDALRREFEKL
jgi:ATP adenylyltransferase